MTRRVAFPAAARRCARARCHPRRAAPPARCGGSRAREEDVSDRRHPEGDDARVLADRSTPARCGPSASSRRRASTCSVIWKGPMREDDREQQIQVVEGFLSQGVSGIVLAPLDARALVRPVEEAGERRTSPSSSSTPALESKKIVSYVATDNLKGGRLAGEHMARCCGGKGKVLMLRYQEGSASTEAREQGFLEALQGVSRHQLDLVRPARRADARHREARVGESAQPLRRPGAGRLRRQRIVRRPACCSRCRTSDAPAR